MTIRSKRKVEKPSFRNFAAFTAFLGAAAVAVVPGARSSENGVCKVSQSDFRGLNVELYGRVWGILESKGYQVISSDDPDRYRLQINWQEYYHHPLHKFAQAWVVLTTPAGRPYETHDTTLSFNIFATYAPSAGPSILSAVEDLPDCSEVLPESASENL